MEKNQKGSQFDGCLNPLAVVRPGPEFLELNLGPCFQWAGDSLEVRRVGNQLGRTA